MGTYEHIALHSRRGCAGVILKSAGVVCHRQGPHKEDAGWQETEDARLAAEGAEKRRSAVDSEDRRALGHGLQVAFGSWKQQVGLPWRVQNRGLLMPSPAGVSSGRQDTRTICCSSKESLKGRVAQGLSEATPRVCQFSPRANSCNTDLLRSKGVEVPMLAVCSDFATSPN